MSLIKSHGPLQRLGRIQSNSLAIPADEFYLGTPEQAIGNAAGLPDGQNCHSAQMTFAIR
jgi:hypothetical protein